MTPFFKEACDLKTKLERNMTHVGHLSNMTLNHEIFLEEVQCSKNKAKLKKASGVEDVPNEVLKSRSLLKVLFCLFKFCIEYSIVPSVWYKAIIKPVPKSSKNDTRIPLIIGVSVYLAQCNSYTQVF